MIMAKKQLRALALLLAALVFGSIVLMACARPGSSTANATSTIGPSSTATSAPVATQPLSCPTGTSVKTGATTFEQACITLSKGDTLQFIPDVASFHQLDYGLWNGTTASPETPSGAPAMKGLKVTGANASVGPFTTAGTYHIYCIVHPSMNLTVIVK
jgi:plastocyanin